MATRAARRLAAAAALALALAAPAAAEIHRWVDEAGNVHFSDQAPPGANAGAGSGSATLQSDAPGRRFEHMVSSALVFEMDVPAGWRATVQPPLEHAIPIQLDSGNSTEFFAVSVERGNRNDVQRMLRPSPQGACEKMRELYASRNLSPDPALRGFKGEHGGGVYFPLVFEGEIADLPLSGMQVAALFGFGEIEGGLYYTFVVVTQPPDPDFEARALEVARSASARLAPSVELWMRESEGPAAPLVAKLRGLALSGDPLAPVFLGDFALDGVGGFERDAAEARRWYQLAADRGSAEGFFGLARLHRNGRGVPKNLALAAEHYARAAEAGHADSALQLAYMHRSGDGVPKDDALMVKWADKAANRGSADALVVLGAAYENGRGTAVNQTAALGFYVMAERAGIRSAKHSAERLKRELQAASAAPPPPARQAPLEAD